MVSQNIAYERVVQRWRHSRRGVKYSDNSTKDLSKKKRDDGGGAKIAQNCVTSFMEDPWAYSMSLWEEVSWLFSNNCSEVKKKR